MTDAREVLDGIEADIENPWKSVKVRSLVAALRAAIDIVEGIPHDTSEEDCWFACAQAKDERGEWASCNDKRAGGPCDCGRDALVARFNRAITQALGGTDA